MAKFVTHASTYSTYLFNSFIKHFPRDFQHFNAFHLHTETNRESPDPPFPVRDTESDPHWGWLGLSCETSQILWFLFACCIKGLQLTCEGWSEVGCWRTMEVSGTSSGGKPNGGICSFGVCSFYKFNGATQKKVSHPL